MDNLKQFEFNPKKNGDDRIKASMNIQCECIHKNN